MLVFNKDNILIILKELAKRMRKTFRDVDINIYVVGGASLTLLCDFRESTVDIDVAKNRNMDFRDIALTMEEEFDLNHNWINNDYMYSKSFSPKLVNYIERTYTFSNYIHYHFVKPACIAAMKCLALRFTTNDLSDIVNVVLYEDTLDSIVEIFKDLYNREFDADLYQQIEAICNYMKVHCITDVNNELSRLLKLYNNNIKCMIEDLM